MFHPNGTIIEDNGEFYQVKDILSEGNKFFKYLLSKSLVLLLCDNKFESIFLYINCIESGLVPILINADSDIFLVERMISEYSPEYVFASSAKNNQFVNYSVFNIFRSYSLFKSNTKSTIKINSNLSLLLSTSGTTGSSKLVRLSFQNLVSNAKSISNYLSLSSVDRAISNLPMNYSFGLSIINSHLFVGGSVVITSESITQRRFWDLFKEFNVTSLSGVPYTYEIIKKFRLLNSDLPSLKTLTQAGGKLSNDLVQHFAKFAFGRGIRFFVMYGQTEGTARLSFLDPKFIFDKLGSIGNPIQDGQFSIFDENGVKVNQPDKTGELIYIGPNVMLGYAKNKTDLALGDINKGILHTGDIAYFDKDGFYFLVGRLKRFIKIFGNRVSLDEVEELLKGLDVETACVGEDNLIIVFILKQENIDLVREFLTKKLGIHFSVINIRIIEEIPKSTSGKTLYSKLPI